MGSGPSAADVSRAANKAADAATARAHEEAKKLYQEQQAEYRMAREEQEEQMLALQRKLEKQSDQAEKERLRQEMEHQREMAARDQQVLRDAMERSEEQMKTLLDQVRIQDERFERMRDQHREEMQQYREQNKSDIEQLVATISGLNQQMEQVVFDPEQPDKYMQVEEQNFDKFCSAAAEHLKRVPKMPKKSIAVLGPSGVGKSTVINAFAGKHVTEIGLAECTDEVSMVYGDGPFDFYDVPGSHDARADFYNIETLHKIKSIHMVILVYESRVDHAAKVAKLMVSINMPFIVVRNKCDFTNYPPQEWEACRDKEMTKLKVYTKMEPPLVFLGMSKDTHNGADIEGLSELRGLVESVMATL
jgi:small GTP-binding protein